MLQAVATLLCLPLAWACVQTAPGLLLKQADSSVCGKVNPFWCTMLCGRRQGHVVPFTRIVGPDAWTAADYPSVEAVAHVLNEHQVAELDAAVAQVLQTGKDLKASASSP